MRKFIQYLTIAAGLGTGMVLPACADDAAPAATEISANVSVAEALNKTKFVTGAPMADAKYYIYVFSASWCGPCRALMPRIVEQYPAMKENKVEVILISCDQTEEVAKDYVEHYKAGLPGLYVKDPGVRNLPGIFMPRAIPTAIIVDAKGNVLSSGHGAKALEWQKVCK